MIFKCLEAFNVDFLLLQRANDARPHLIKESLGDFGSRKVPRPGLTSGSATMREPRWPHGVWWRWSGLSWGLVILGAFRALVSLVIRQACSGGLLSLDRRRMLWHALRPRDWSRQ